MLLQVFCGTVAVHDSSGALGQYSRGFCAAVGVLKQVHSGYWLMCQDMKSSNTAIWVCRTVL